MRAGMHGKLNGRWHAHRASDADASAKLHAWELLCGWPTPGLP